MRCFEHGEWTYCYFVDRNLEIKVVGKRCASGVTQIITGAHDDIGCGHLAFFVFVEYRFEGGGTEIAIPEGCFDIGVRR